MGKDIDFTVKNDLAYGRGYVYSLQYHLVWCTKYRKKVLRGGINTECREMLEALAQEYKFRIMAVEVMPDHIHLLVDCRPQFYIPDMIKIMKGNLARRLFIRHPELKEELWGGHLWNPSYCAVTVSDRSREQVEEYIRSQKEKAWGGKGRPPRDLERLQRYHREVLDADHAMSRSGDAGKQQIPEGHSDVSS